MASWNKVNINFRIPPTIRPFPEFEKPCPIGVFGLNGNRDYMNNGQNLKYYVKPEPDVLPIDLNVGLENAIRRDPKAQEGLSHLLSFIAHNYESLGLKRQATPRQFLPYDFICYRGLLTLLAETLFATSNDWTILITRFKGNYYLCRFKTEEEIKAIEMAREDQKLASLWKYKFQQYCLADSPSDYPDDSRRINENQEFNCVFRSSLRGYRLLYAAEMDGVMNTEEIDASKRQNLPRLQFVELNTRERNLSERKMQAFKDRKARKWWLQAFFVGVETLALGLRNSKGQVQEVTHIDTKTLRKMKPQNWTGNQCFHFIVNFLDAIRETIGSVDDPQTTFVFNFRAEQKEIYYQKHEGWSDYTFLNNSYIQFVNEKYSDLLTKLPMVYLAANPVFVHQQHTAPAYLPE